VWIEREQFHGWACSMCAWAFKRSGPPGGKSIEEMKKRYETERDKAFRSHVCAEYSRIATV